MFRIHFDPKLSRFVLQVKTVIFWRTAMTTSESGKKPAPMLFKTYDLAMDHANDIGLNKLYRDGSRNMFDAFLNGVDHIGKGYERITNPNGVVTHERFFKGSGASNVEA